MMGLGLLFVAVAASAQPTEFQLDTDTPDALCPELSMTREAVRQRLGQLETEAGAHWRGSYSTVHDPSGRRGDYVRLVIRDAQGKEHLDRKLPLKGESCDTLAQAIALVVDGFFRELVQSSERDAADTPKQKTQEPVAIDTAAVPEIRKKAQVPPRNSAAAATAKRPDATGFAFGADYETALSKPALDLGGFSRLAGQWQLQLRASLPLSRVRESHGGGMVTGYPVPVRISASYVVEPLKRLQWFLGPQLLLSFEHASTQDIPNGNSGWKASAGLGAQSGVAIWLTPSLAVAGGVSVDQVLFQNRRFLMYEQPALELARTRVSGTLGLWISVWP